jgi:hypothetical protein
VKSQRLGSVVFWRRCEEPTAPVISRDTPQTLDVVK